MYRQQKDRGQEHAYVLYPISAAGYRSMARMKEVTPRLKALQEKYKDDKQRLNQAMMELYSRNRIEDSFDNTGKKYDGPPPVSDNSI